MFSGFLNIESEISVQKDFGHVQVHVWFLADSLIIIIISVAVVEHVQSKLIPY